KGGGGRRPVLPSESSPPAPLLGGEGGLLRAGLPSADAVAGRRSPSPGWGWGGDGRGGQGGRIRGAERAAFGTPAVVSLRPHSMAFGVVLELAEAQRFHEWRNIDAEASPKALLEAVPTTDRIVRGPPPGLDGPLLGGFLLVRPAELDPISGRLEHGVQ